ncbi:ComEC/Rec2 family competence protein [Candidatus Poribacteria bacterium]|nr:ComEC/Rec2 family competence protein [Candidatus Poribacteria bacterium]
MGMKLKLRPALYFLLPFLLGIIIGEYTSIPILWLWIFIVLCFVGTILTRNKTRFMCYVLINIAIFGCGMLRFEIASFPKIPNHYFDQPVSFNGKTVYQPERGKEWDACYAVGQIQLLSDPSQEVSAKLLIRFDKLMPLRYGKQIKLTGDLRQAPTKRNPGGFNYRTYLERQNVSGILYHQGLVSIGKQSGIPPLRWIETLRLKTEQVIDDAYAGLETQSTNTSGIEETPSNDTTLHAKLLKGILLGKRGDLPSETLEIFRNSGTFHVLAVSGLHVGLIAFFCYLALSAFRRIPKKVVSLLTIIAVLIYACLVGFRPSVFRASLMVILYLIATIIDRDADIYNLLAIAALTLLLLNPTQLGDVGFQLSFVAVTSIVFFVPKMEKPLQKLWNDTESTNVSTLQRYKNIAIKWLVLSYLVTFAAQIGTTPLIAYHFYRAYPLGIIVGPFAVGLVSLIVGIGMVLSVLVLSGYHLPKSLFLSIMRFSMFF